MDQLETNIAAGHAVMLNAISYFETRRGLTDGHGRKRARFELLMQEADVLDLDRAALDIAASVYQALRNAGTPLEDADILMADIAPANDAVLVTRNVKHFARIQELKLEHWES